MTIERSSYLAGLVDMARWEEEPEYTAELFLDRDPELFAQLLRLMRQVPLVAGLLPRDNPGLFAALLAEADFFGFEALLQHVKAKTYFNCREAKDDYKQLTSFLPDNYGFLDSGERQQAQTTARAAAAAQKGKVFLAFQTKDEVYGANHFDKIYGSIADALAADVLPTCYSSPPKKTTKIVQLLPVESTTWLLAGDTHDYRATVVPNAVYPENDEMRPMSELIKTPNFVRRVACHALFENERDERWVEPLIYLAPTDQQNWMNDQPWDGVIQSRMMTMDDPRLATITGGHGHGRRIVRVSTWLETSYEMSEASMMANMIKPNRMWTHLLVGDEPPDEVPFIEAGTYLAGDDDA